MSYSFVNLYAPADAPIAHQSTGPSDPRSEQRERIRAANGMINPVHSTFRPYEAPVASPDGTQQNKNVGGRPKHQAHEMTTELETWFRENPTSLLRDAQKFLKQKFGVETSTTTISRILKASKLQGLRTKYGHTRPRQKRGPYKKKGRAGAVNELEDSTAQALQGDEFAAADEEMEDQANGDAGGSHDSPPPDPHVEALRRELGEAKERISTLETRPPDPRVEMLLRELGEAKERIARLETQMKDFFRTEQQSALCGRTGKQKGFFSQFRVQIYNHGGQAS